MTQSPQQGLVAFRPRARLLKLIGAELISDDVLAIMELVKNAHDADASEAVISFHSTSRPDGEIVVRDDGSGMDLDTLLGLWMQPASTSKRTSSGRRTASAMSSPVRDVVRRQKRPAWIRFPPS